MHITSPRGFSKASVYSEHSQGKRRDCGHTAALVMRQGKAQHKQSGRNCSCSLAHMQQRRELAKLVGFDFLQILGRSPSCSTSGELQVSCEIRLAKRTNNHRRGIFISDILLTINPIFMVELDLPVKHTSLVIQN